MAEQIELFKNVTAPGKGEETKQATRTKRGPRWLNPRTVARLTAEQREEYRQIIKPEAPRG